MNFIIDAEGKVIDLKSNILELLSDDQKNGNGSLKIQSILSGLPEIFPLTDSKNFKTYKNLVLKKDIGPFSTNPGQHFYSLNIQIPVPCSESMRYENFFLCFDNLI